MEALLSQYKDIFSLIFFNRYFVETAVIALIIYQLFFRRKKQKETGPTLTEKEKDDLIAQWVPEPLVPESDASMFDTIGKQIDGKMGKTFSIDGKEYANLATSNFLCFVGNEKIESAAKASILKYGVGSCGPRGFYGTVDVHLELEKQISEFMGCEEAVLYSYGFATIASAIPAYAKRGDIIYADKGSNFSIQKGLQASRSKIEWFNHNDMEDLERLLKIQDEKDKSDSKKAKSTRRFIVVEGLYAKTSDLCPLPKLIELKWKYKVRIFMDESYSFGVLGKTGRGVTEHYSINPFDVDMIMVSLENAISTTGGFCCGRSYVVGHQRLSGLGYCFSASLPPLLATAAKVALKIIDEEPERIQRLSEISRKFHNGLIDALKGSEFYVQADPLSPMKFVHYKDEEKSDQKLTALKDELFNNNIAVARSRYLNDSEAFPVKNSLKIMCNCEMEQEEIEKYLTIIKNAVSHLA